MRNRPEYVRMKAYFTSGSWRSTPPLFLRWPTPQPARPTGASAERSPLPVAALSRSGCALPAPSLAPLRVGILAAQAARLPPHPHPFGQRQGLLLVLRGVPFAGSPPHRLPCSCWSWFTSVAQCSRLTGCPLLLGKISRGRVRWCRRGWSLRRPPACSTAWAGGCTAGQPGRADDTHARAGLPDDVLGRRSGNEDGAGEGDAGAGPPRGAERGSRRPGCARRRR